LNSGIYLHSPSSLHNLKYGDQPDPAQPQAGEITIRLGASSLNYHDYAVATGLIPVKENRTTLSDGAGKVIAVGSGVTNYALGDLVVSTFFPYWASNLAQTQAQDSVRIPGDSIDGFARDEVTFPASWFTHAPTGYNWAQAATLPCAGLTAWRALQSDNFVGDGATVLVQGTGGVSIFALQFAKALGATVIATSSSNEKLTRRKQLGAAFRYQASGAHFGKIVIDIDIG
jgi:NADPH:quinone reductase-like Zn-dependent oxidoreductase